MLAMYLNVMQSLQRRGYSVFSLDHQGHGDSDGDPFYFETIAHLSDELDFMVSKIHEIHKTVPIYIVGHELGARSVFLCIINI